MNRLGWIVLLVLMLGTAMFATTLHQRPREVPVPRNEPRAKPLPPSIDTTSVAAAPVVPPLVTTGALVVPVAGVRPEQLTDNWHDPREGGARAHEALDIPAPRDTPVLAAFAGKIDKLFESTRGGTTLYVRSPDGATEAYYAHLSHYADLLREGQDVKQGQTIAYVGDSGDAGPGNTHLHFALAHMGPGDKWWQGTPYNPYPLLAGKPSSR